ncbi:MAG: hypothetical protein OJF59_002516 [Cytophagales bacterium]|jgi:hypothetical protein|nr:hypothetical protein [Bacteroidota bacterium]MBS1980240.1 hypothetical protein [Bacteroidota bacterium]WHZ08762.1 MAG: hypothetical protein OJF59_002516 [Cytophagales bacterium]
MELQNKKTELIESMEAMNEVLKKENRTAFTADEKTKFESLKTQVKEVNERIEEQKFIDENKRSEAKASFINSGVVTPTILTANSNAFGSAFRSFLSGKSYSAEERAYLDSEMEKIPQEYKPRGDGRQFYIPQEVLKKRKAEKRAALTSSNVLTRLTQENELSFAAGPILYNQIGVKEYNVTGTKLDLPSLADYSVTIAGEGGSVSPVTLTSSHVSAVAQVISVQASFTRQMLASTNEDIMNDVLDTMSFVADKAIDTLMINAITASTSATLTGVTTYSQILQLEASMNTVPNTFISTFKGRNFWKKTLENPAGTDATFVWQKDNSVAGYRAYASPYISSKSFVTLLDASAVAVVKFSGLLLIEDVYTLAAQNQILYNLIQLVDVKVANPAFVTWSNGGGEIG